MTKAIEWLLDNLLNIVTCFFVFVLLSYLGHLSWMFLTTYIFN